MRTSAATRIGTRIRAMREQREWSQERLAEEAAMTGARVSRYERGITLPRAWSVRMLALALGCTVAELDPDNEALPDDTAMHRVVGVSAALYLRARAQVAKRGVTMRELVEQLLGDFLDHA